MQHVLAIFFTKKDALWPILREWIASWVIEMMLGSHDFDASCGMTIWISSVMRIFFGISRLEWTGLNLVIGIRNSSMSLSWSRDGTSPFMARDYFKSIYSAEGSYQPWPYGNASPRFTQAQLLCLQCAPLDEEIKSAVFEMGPLKTPRPDGLHPFFFSRPNGRLLGSQFAG